MTTTLRGIETIVVEVYASTNDSNQQVKESFYGELSNVHNEMKIHQQIILLGYLPPE